VSEGGANRAVSTEVKLLTENQFLLVPQGVVYRLAKPSKVPEYERTDTEQG